MLSILQIVADNLPDEIKEQLKEIFEMVDSDNNGNLTFEELRDGLHKIGHHVTDPDVQMLLDTVSVYCVHFLPSLPV